MTGTRYGIVAGYDGSPGAAQALRWAAREAWARGAELTVSLAWTPDQMELPTESDLCDLARQHGREILTRGLPYAESVLGPGRVRADLAAGPAARVLCERSRDADMVVVGSRGHGELPGVRLGSVSWQVAGHASGRVVVVRGPWRPANRAPGPIVCGPGWPPCPPMTTRSARADRPIRARAGWPGTTCWLTGTPGYLSAQLPISSASRAPAVAAAGPGPGQAWIASTAAVRRLASSNAKVSGPAQSSRSATPTPTSPLVIGDRSRTTTTGQAACAAA